jgi:Uma2 family endonuclease
MALLTAPKSWTYHDYLQLPDEDRCEIMEGRLERIMATPSCSHQMISANLFVLLHSFVQEKKLGIDLFAPTDVILDEENVVQPDLLFISHAHKSLIQERGIFGPPDLVIEITSPSSHYKDTQEKLRLYEKFKIPEYWLVDPYHKVIEVFSLDKEGKYRLFAYGYLEPTGKKKVNSQVLPDFEVDLEKLFQSV